MNTYGSPLTLPLAALGVGGAAILGARPGRSIPVKRLAVLAGLALIGVAAHRPLANALRRAGTRRRASELRFSFVVDRPVERVFAFCADFENFPRFIGALREVRDSGDGRSHWSASTPSGGTIEWDAVTTKYVTNSVLAWRSVIGSPVEASGLVRFSPEDGKTCVQVAVSYRVLDGPMADAIAALIAPPRRRFLEAEIRSFETHLALASSSDNGATE
jgi:uncharacterized membrane protein